MARRQRDDDFDQRLDWEIIVDANGPDEQALGWYYYLEITSGFHSRRAVRLSVQRRHLE
jgi:Calcium binding